MRWDYQGRKLHVAMPEYVEKTLNEFQHETKNEKNPHLHAQEKHMEKIPKS